MTRLLSQLPVIATSATNDWMRDHLTEARGILADVPQHAETLVILACQVVAAQTNDANECADAVELLRFLDRCPLQAIGAAALPNGNAA